ncbi:MAG: universal stress protein [Armatimonadetes bacterium]|nr:universal stress protein [Armatimonadota bacterium]
MIRNIMVGYDGSRLAEVAAEQAMELAEAAGGRLHVVHVQPTPPGEDDLAAGERELDIVSAALPREEADADQPEPEPMNLEELHRLCEARHIGCEEEHLYGRNPGPRLLRRSWLTDLLVIGRGREREHRAGDVGPTTDFLLSELVAPTLVCARQHVELRSVLVPYRVSVSGGRALSFAAHLCELMNAKLTALVCEPDRIRAGQALEAAERALRAYDIEGDHAISLNSPLEALRTAALERESSLIVVPGAHKRNYILPWSRNQVLWRALEIPGCMVLAHP